MCVGMSLFAFFRASIVSLLCLFSRRAKVSCVAKVVRTPRSAGPIVADEKKENEQGRRGRKKDKIEGTAAKKNEQGAQAGRTE